MISKTKNKAYYVINNVPNEEAYYMVHRFVMDGIYWLDRNYRQGAKASKSDIDSCSYSMLKMGINIYSRCKTLDIDLMWIHEYKNEAIEFNSTRKCPARLAYDLLELFNKANDYWLQNKHKVSNSSPD